MNKANSDSAAASRSTSETTDSPKEEKLSDYTALFESGLFSDCVIKCGDKVWRLHKAFLCSRSRFFRAAFTGVFEEAKTGDLTLREQDSDLVDLRCDTSTPLETFAKMEAVETITDTIASDETTYSTLVPLFKLADFLGLDSLCIAVISQLRIFNTKQALEIQKSWWEQLELGKEPEKGWGLTDRFKTTFTECAKIAYSLPKSSKHEVWSRMLRYPSDPVGIRRPFIEILRLTRFAVVHDSEFLSVWEQIPELMTDIVVAMGQWGKGYDCSDFP